jgi:hypothetical protein
VHYFYCLHSPGVSQALSGAVSGIVWLWKSQLHHPAEFKGVVYKRENKHPRSDTIRLILSGVRNAESAEATADCRDTSIGNLTDGIEHMGVVREMATTLLVQGTFVSLRTRLDVLLGISSLARGQDKRKLRLCDLHTWHASTVGPHVCKFLLCGLPGHMARKTACAPYLACVRHRDPLLCSVGAVALYLYCRYTVHRETKPDFQKRSSWMKVVLLQSTTAVTVEERSREIPRSTEATQLKKIFDLCDVTSSKLTHAFRKVGVNLLYMMSMGELNDGEEDEHGGWAGQNVRQTAYKMLPAVQACLILGGHGTGKPWNTTHHLNRDQPKDEPATVVSAIFDNIFAAWLAERTAGTAMMADGTPLEGNSVQFCKTLKWLAVVLVQDAPFLRNASPDSSIWRHPPFNTAAFDEYAKRVLLREPPAPASAAGASAAGEGAAAGAAASESATAPAGAASLDMEVADAAAAVAATVAENNAAATLIDSEPIRRCFEGIVAEMRARHAYGVAHAAAAAAGAAASMFAVVAAGELDTPAPAATSAASIAASTAARAATLMAAHAAGGGGEAAAAAVPFVSAIAAGARDAGIAERRLRGPYHMSQTFTSVTQVWAEFADGSSVGQPGIRAIKLLHGAQWQNVGRCMENATQAREAKLIIKRRAKRGIVWDEVMRTTPDYASESAAAAGLQDRFLAWQALCSANTLDAFITKLLLGESQQRGDRITKRKIPA